MERQGQNQRFPLSSYYFQPPPPAPWVRTWPMPHHAQLIKPPVQKMAQKGQWFCHRCGTQHSNPHLSKCRNKSCQSERPNPQSSTGQQVKSERTENINGLPKILETLFMKHTRGATQGAATEASQAAQDAEMADPPATPQEAQPEQDLQELAKLKAQLDKFGMTQQAEEVGKKIEALANTTAKQAGNAKKMLDAAARFARNAESEVERNEAKVAKVRTAYEKAQQELTEARANAATAASMHKEALDTYAKSADLDTQETQSSVPHDATAEALQEKLAASLQEAYNKRVGAGNQDTQQTEIDWAALAASALDSVRSEVINESSAELPRKKAATETNRVNQ